MTAVARRRIRIIAGAGVLVLLTAAPVAAVFDGTTAAGDRVAVETAELAAVEGGEAAIDVGGVATVGWSAPNIRPDVEPEYVIERTVDGATKIIDPQITGHGFSDDLSVPATIDGKTVSQVAAGVSHTCAIAEGRAYCWGENEYGQLGNGSYRGQWLPVRVSGLDDVTHISAGRWHTCAIAGDHAYCWGGGIYGQLGLGPDVAGSPAPREVADLGDVTYISAGDWHTCAIASGGGYCWGSSTWGQVGDGGTANRVPSPVAVTGPLTGVDATSISAGEKHTCAIANGGLAYCWGEGADGRLGHNSTTDSTVPVRAGGLFAVTDISAGGEHSCAIAGGRAYCWGQGDHGQLGDIGLTHRTLPVLVRTDHLGAGPIRQIDLGQYHSCAIGTAPRVYCWGQGTSGQLGVEDTRHLPAPYPVGAPLDTMNVSSIGIGHSHSCAVSAGTAYCWGHGANGRLGNDSTATQELPVTVLPGDMGGNLTCAGGWQPHDGRCTPGPDIGISYQIGYTQRGWTAPTATVAATWTE